MKLFEQVDVNKNGIVERSEFIQFFAQSMQVKGLAIPQDVELLCEALDMNKDNLISVNEFCLCLEGVQHSLDQRLRSFDPDLEKSLKDEVNLLFDFFDINKDGTISLQELQQAMKASNPSMTPGEIELMMKQVDANNSNTIDREEFMAAMLP